jgi:hypothetical protein
LKYPFATVALCVILGGERALAWSVRRRIALFIETATGGHDSDKGRCISKDLI